jgi:hypothetical protein
MESQPPAPQPTPKLLEQVRNVMRLHHYSIHTERSYTDWIKRYIHFSPDARAGNSWPRS